MTNRPTNEIAEWLIGEYFPVLDHGFVSLFDYMGTEESIDRITRVSHASEARDEKDIARLIGYRARHRHTTPSEFAQLVFHIRAPIFVARQWMRHRTASISELSGRYTAGTGLCYMPDLWRLQSTANKQGSDTASLLSDSEIADNDYSAVTRGAADLQGWLEEHKVAHELSRIALPLSTYTEWYWRIDLHNLLHFLTLREDPHAQQETRDYARVLAGIVKRAYPATYDAWLDQEVLGARFSGREMDLLRKMLLYGFSYSIAMGLEQSQLSPSEKREFEEKLKSQNKPDHKIELTKTLTLSEARGR